MAAAWLVIWQLIHTVIGKEVLIPAPLAVLSRLAELAVQGEFWQHIGLSLLKILIGYLSALLFGGILGILTARSRLLDALLSPAAKIIRATPVASFIILMFVFLSKEHIPAVTSFLMVLPVVWSNTYEGIKSANIKLLEMAKVFRLSRAKTLLRIYLPGIFPFIMAAAKSGMGLAWKAGIAAEVLVPISMGIGSELYNAKIYLETVDLFAWTAVIIIISMMLEKLLVRLARRLHDTP